MVRIQVTEAHSGRPIELREGDTVELCLPEAPDTGFLWRWGLPEGLRMITDEHLAETPGAGLRRLAIDVYARGRYELRAELARPCDCVPQRALTFTVHAQ